MTTHRRKSPFKDCTGAPLSDGDTVRDIARRDFTLVLDKGVWFLKSGEGHTESINMATSVTYLKIGNSSDERQKRVAEERSHYKIVEPNGKGIERWVLTDKNRPCLYGYGGPCMHPNCLEWQYSLYCAANNTARLEKEVDLLSRENKQLAFDLGALRVIYDELARKPCAK